MGTTTSAEIATPVEGIYESENFNRRARILSLDGGGVRGLVTLQILMELEKKIQAIDPEQNIRTCFDLICGTSTGGILAMALVTTDLTLQEINQKYMELPSKVFTGWGWWNSLKVTVGSALFMSNTKYAPNQLEHFIDETFGKGRKLRDSKNKWNKDLKGFVTATRIDTDRPDLYLFRSYNGEDRKEADVHQVAGTCNETDLNVLVKDALRATSAAPTYFPSINVENGTDNLGTFVDGGFLANNPVEVGVAESFELWPRRGVSTVLSLGTGSARNEEGGGESRSNLAYAMTALELATESHRASARMSAMAKIVRLMAINEVRAGLEEMDQNHDGKISAEEFHNYLAKFRIHKAITSIPDSFKDFGDDQTVSAERINDLFKLFKKEIDQYHDFPEYFRLNTPHTIDGRVIDLGHITLDTTDQAELDRMCDETNAWLQREEIQTQLERIAARLTHKPQEVMALVRHISTQPNTPIVRQLSSTSAGGLSSLDIEAHTMMNDSIPNEVDTPETIAEDEEVF